MRAEIVAIMIGQQFIKFGAAGRILSVLGEWGNASTHASTFFITGKAPGTPTSKLVRAFRTALPVTY